MHLVNKKFRYLPFYFYTNFNNKVILFRYGYKVFKNYYKNCEPETKKFLKTTLKKKFNIIDCGCNVGYFSYIFSILAPLGRIYSIDGSSDNLIKFRKNFKNKLKNISTIHKALSSKSVSKSAKIHSVWNHKTEKKVFKFKTLDALFAFKKTKIDFIKIDCDGYEYDILLGSKLILKQYKPILCVEISKYPLFFKEKNKIIKFLEKKNYRLRKILDKENHIFFYNG